MSIARARRRSRNCNISRRCLNGVRHRIIQDREARSVDNNRGLHRAGGPLLHDGRPPRQLARTAASRRRGASGSSRRRTSKAAPSSSSSRRTARRISGNSGNGPLPSATTGRSRDFIDPGMALTDTAADRLLDILGHRFAQPALLTEALTHASAVPRGRGAVGTGTSASSSSATASSPRHRRVAVATLPERGRKAP